MLFTFWEEVLYSTTDTSFPSESTEDTENVFGTGEAANKSVYEIAPDVLLDVNSFNSTAGVGVGLPGVGSTGVGIESSSLQDAKEIAIIAKGKNSFFIC